MFAIKFKMVRLQNKVVDESVGKFTEGGRLPGAEDVAALWKPQPGAGQLRMLFIELFAQKGGKEVFEGVAASKWHAEFMKGKFLPGPFLLRAPFVRISLVGHDG